MSVTAPCPEMPSDVVVDASVALHWFVPSRRSQQALLWLDPRFSVRRHVPEGFLARVAESLRSGARRLGPGEAQQVLCALRQVPLEVHPAAPLLDPALELAMALGRPVDECLSLALALAVGGPLVTSDNGLVRAVAQGPLAGAVRGLDPIGRRRHPKRLAS